MRHPERWVRHFLAAPFIYASFVPLVLLDIWLELYHRVCFPLYGIPYVQRARYFKYDREKLPYLTPIDQINCKYCAYANGLLRYATVIAGETEKYWCGIQHQKDPNFIPPEHHKDFLPYGDEKALKEFVAEGK